MTEPQHIDPERLAALLDGRLSPADAAAVRQQLAEADDDTLAAYADAVAVSADLANAGPKDVGVIPIDSARRGRRWLAVAGLAAAGVVAVFVYQSTTTDHYLPAMYASAVPSTASMRPEQPWSTTRGPTDEISDRSRAVRVGVLLTDLGLDALRNDTSSAHAIALEGLLGTLDGSGPLVAALRDVMRTRDTAAGRERVREIGKLTLTFVDQPLANAGAYLEAARIAMFSGDSTFIVRFPPRPLLELKNDARLDTAAKKQLLLLEADLKTRPSDTSYLAMQFTTLLQMLAQ